MKHIVNAFQEDQGNMVLATEGTPNSKQQDRTFQL